MVILKIEKNNNLIYITIRAITYITELYLFMQKVDCKYKQKLFANETEKD